MAYKKLKTFKAYGVNPDGTRGHFRASTDQQIFIEATGACRLFVKVPDFLAGALPSWKNHSTTLETIGDKTAAGPEHILVSRDPDELEKGWNQLCAAYTEWCNTRDIKQFIGIKGERKHRSGNTKFEANQHTADIDLTFTRFLQDVGGAEKQTYQWREKEDDRLQKIRVGASDWHIVPYSTELWVQLIAFQTQINQAQERLQDLIKEGTFAQRLLAGGGALLLGND